MTIVLMPHCGFLSETSRMLHLAEALQAKGMPVVLATHGGPYTPVLERAALPVVRVSPAMDSARCTAFIEALVDMGRPGVRLQPADEVRASVAAESQLLREVGARALVTGFTLTGYLSSRVAGVPLITSHGGSFVPPVFEHGLAPVPTTMPIPGTEWLPDWLKRRIANSGPLRLTGPVQFLNDIAKEQGLEPVPSLAAMMTGDLTLVTDVPDVLGLSDHALTHWIPRVPTAVRRGTRHVYTGPLFAQLPIPVPPQVEAALGSDVPTALVVLSSATVERLRAVVARVRAAGVRVIVGATIHDFGPNADPEIIVAGVLPNHLVMPRVDVVVCMGGQGTVQTAMASGTPLVGIPLHPEQEFNVALAARMGAGIAIAPRHCDAARMTAAVRRVLDEPGFRTGAARARAAYSGIDGAARAADAIMSFVGAAG